MKRKCSFCPNEGRIGQDIVFIEDGKVAGTNITKRIPACGECLKQFNRRKPKEARHDAA